MIELVFSGRFWWWIVSSAWKSVDNWDNLSIFVRGNQSLQFDLSTSIRRGENVWLNTEVERARCLLFHWQLIGWSLVRGEIFCFLFKGSISISRKVVQKLLPIWAHEKTANHRANNWFSSQHMNRWLTHAVRALNYQPHCFKEMKI